MAEGTAQQAGRKVVNVDTLGIERTGDGEYSFVFQITWDDNKTSVVKHPYESLFKFQCELLDAFPIDAGATGSPRTIPPLPGKKLFGGLSISKSGRDHAAKSLAEKRLPGVVNYIQQLIRLPEYITQSELMLSLFDAEAASSPTVFRRRMSSVSAATAEETLKLKLEDPLAIKSGYLTKLGANVKSWKRRWFVLSGVGKIVYYKGPRTAGSSVAPLGSVRLQEITSLPEFSEMTCQWPSDVDPSCCFGIVSPARTHYLFADTAQEAQAWRETIQTAMKSLQDSMSRQSSNGSLNKHRTQASRLIVEFAPTRSPAITPTSSPSVSRRSSSDPPPSAFEAVTRQRQQPREGAWERSVPPPPQHDWAYAEDASGNVYYINTKTMETSWTLPEGIVANGSSQ